MDRNRILSPARVAACQDHGNRYFLSESSFEYHLVPLLETIQGKRQTAQLIFAIRVRASQIKDQMWGEAHGNSQRPSEPVEIFIVAGSIAQIYIDGGRG